MEEYKNKALCSVGPAGGAAPAAIRRETFKPHGETGSRIGAGDAGDLVFDQAAATAKRRISVTLDGLRQALDSLAALHGHKSVVLISEGFVLLPKMTGYWDVIDAARRANVAVHVIDPRGLESGFSAEFQDAPAIFGGTRRELDFAGAGDLSDATGGRTIANNDPAGALRQVAEESEAYYLLGYTPEATRPGERKVHVRVRREDLVVRARSRYYVEREADLAKAAAKKKKNDERTGFDTAAVAAMRSAADTTGLPLRASTLFFDANARGEVATLVAAEVDPPAGRRHVRLVAEARRADGGPPVHQQFDETVDVHEGSPVVVAREWRLPPGVWQVRVLAEDAASGRVGTAVHTFEVPAATALRVSTPILTDEIEGDRGGARPRLTLRRAFAARGRLYCQFSVYDSAGATGVTPASPRGGSCGRTARSSTRPRRPRSPPAGTAASRACSASLSRARRPALTVSPCACATRRAERRWRRPRRSTYRERSLDGGGRDVAPSERDEGRDGRRHGAGSRRAAGEAARRRRPPRTRPWRASTADTRG